MSEDKKRAPRRLPFGDELEYFIRNAKTEELTDLAVRVAKESRYREMQARRLPLLAQESK